MNKLIKFAGKALAIPFKIIRTLIIIGLLPIRMLINWLDGYGNYNKAYWKFAKHVFKKTWEAIKRGEKPTLHQYAVYMDDQQYLVLLNEIKNPIIFSGFRN